MGSGEDSLNQMTISSGLSSEGGVVSQGNLAFLPKTPDTFVTGMTASDLTVFLTPCLVTYWEGEEEPVEKR